MKVRATGSGVDVLHRERIAYLRNILSVIENTILVI